MYILLSLPGKTENIHTNSEWRVRRWGGGGTLFCLEEMVLWEKFENRWNWYSCFRCYDVLDLIFDRERPTRICFPFPRPQTI